MKKSLERFGASLLAAASLIVLVSCAPADSVGEPGVEATLSSEASAALVDRFQAALDAAWAAAQDTDENFPGATAAFILPDGQVFGFATGESDVDDDIPMSADMRMPSGSIGKTYVAAVSLRLHMEGLVDLDTPVSTWLGDEPWFSRLPNADALTTRNLLNHTAGMIQPYFEDEAFAQRLGEVFGSGPDAYMPPDQFIMETVVDDEPLFPAGEGYHYSDVHYIIAGLAMEAATGRTYYDMLDEFFLDRFGLDFTLAADRPELPGLSQGYAHASSQLFGMPMEVLVDGAMIVNPLQEWTGGGVINNPQDLVRWAKLLYEGDAIDGDGELAELLEVGFPADAENPHLGYGLGVFVADSDHGITYGHGGFFPGYNSLVSYYPDHEVAVAIQINSDAAQYARHLNTLADIVIGALPDA